MDAEDQIGIDRAMIALDGTPNKAALAPMPFSVCRSPRPRPPPKLPAMPLYRYVGGASARILPVPMMNIINGGAHADNPIDFQEFMIMPVGAPTFKEALRMGAEVFHTLKGALKKAGHNTNVGDEGGFAPNLPSAEAALDFVMKSIEQAGYKPGQDIAWPSTVRRDRILQGRKLRLRRRRKTRSIKDAGGISRQAGQGLSDHLHRRRHVGRRLGRLEAGDGSHRQQGAAGGRRPVRHQHQAPARTASQEDVANSILVKVNQIGSLTETLEAVEMAHKAGYTAVMSHRSGETEDSTIADLAVATNCGSDQPAGEIQPARWPAQGLKG
jgi:enolase